ncbi:U-box domain-containing protein 11 [Salvia miltiorrhiza]|uniref:U-box domain-containing protein 11 n=1 Tax=Salvia miltiorrhiza TaxID=226208 RepID=UPI0025ACCAC5|nr:U-box domain-containing protein 11 [Salvia miltiorrhiza]
MFVKMPNRNCAPAHMAGEETTVVNGAATLLLRLVRDVVRVSAAGFSGFFKRECTELGRRVSLLVHFLEEIRDSEIIQQNCEISSSFSTSGFADLSLALQVAKRLVVAANNFDNSNSISADGATKKILFQFQCITWKLEKALDNLPYDDFNISEEVLEQVELVRSQLRRAAERYGRPLNSSLSQPSDKEIHVEKISNFDHEASTKMEDLSEGVGAVDDVLNEVLIEEDASNSSMSAAVVVFKDSESPGINSSSCKALKESKKPDSLVVPDDLRCPISLELMRDPVIVATGQTYERCYIQRWVDCGNITCPKTGQMLQNLTLTPNYVLRSLISQWCTKHEVVQPTSIVNGRLKRSDGSFRDVKGDMAAIEALVCRLASRCIEEIRAAVAEIRSLSKRSTDNRILLAEAGAIPIIVNLLTSNDAEIQDNAVTSILNLSIYDDNKELIMLANAVPCVVQVLRDGSMEAKENAAATLFCLSLADENKIIIGASGAIPALVDLLQNGNSRGKKDAATALFNLCIYQGNKGRAVRAGIVTALIKMLTTSSSMVDEALTILSVLASHHEAKTVLVRASTIPVLTDLLRTGLPRCRENAVAILLSLCRRDNANLACLSRLGAAMLLSELVESGTERAKRKAASLLEQLRNSQEVRSAEL